MHRSLLFLSLLRLRGGWRKFRRTLMTPKGVALALPALALVALILLPSLLAEVPPDARRSPAVFLHPGALFMFWMLGCVGGRAKSPIAFSLAEVEFLFPGPFGRRQLLTYKLATSALGALGFAGVTPLFMGRYLTVWWPAALVGLWWTVTFIQMSTTLVALFVEWLGERSKPLLTATAVLAVAGIASSLWQTGALAGEIPLADRLELFLSGWAVQAVLSPFVVFNRFICATTPREALGWGTAALVMNLVVVALIMLLDAVFIEASLAASQRRYEILQRAKRAGGVPSIGLGSKPRWGLPLFPRLWGVGTIAWRQALHLMRGSGRLLLLVPILVGPFVAVTVVSRHGHTPSLQILLPVIALLGFFITTIMPLGLRVDLNHVDTIKTLPISPAAIVWGSNASAIVYTTLIQLVTAAVLAACLGDWLRGTATAIAVALPLNLLLIASDSVLVLVFPSVRSMAPGDPFVGMRMALVYLAKVLYLGAASAVGGAVAFLVYLGLGEEQLAIGAAGWIVVMGEGLLTIWFAALLFARYDPSADATEQE